MKEPSAVEWYAEEFAEHLEETYGIKITNLTLLNKAKILEKKIIKHTWDEGVISATYGKAINFEQYYNETFK